MEINDFPDEVILHIMHYLPLQTVVTCENVCRRWRNLSQSPTIWKNIAVVYSGKPGQTEVSEETLEILTSHSRLVRHVKLQYINYYTQILSILRPCVNIEKLELVMCRISAELVNDLNLWPNLTLLNLKNSLLAPGVRPILLHLQHSQLTSLRLAHFGLSSCNLNTVLNCKKLCHLFIEKITTLCLDDITNILTSKKNIIKSFHMYGGSSVDDGCLKLVAECPHLKDLAIIRCENLTDCGLRYLGSIDEMKCLLLWNSSRFTELGLLSTFASPNLFLLRKLSLSRIINISTDIIDFISVNYQNLTFLALYQCPKICHTASEYQLQIKFPGVKLVLH